MKDRGLLSPGKTPTKYSLMWAIGCHVIPMRAFVWNLITRERQFWNEGIISKLSRSSLFLFKFIHTIQGHDPNFRERSNFFYSLGYIYLHLEKYSKSEKKVENFRCLSVSFSQSTMWQYVVLTFMGSCSLFLVADCYTAVLICVNSNPESLVFFALFSSVNTTPFSPPVFKFQVAEQNWMLLL